METEPLAVEEEEETNSITIACTVTLDRNTASLSIIVLHLMYSSGYVGGAASMWYSVQ